MKWHRIVEGLVNGDLAYVCACVCVCARACVWKEAIISYINYYFGIYWIDLEEKSKHFVRVVGPLLGFEVDYWKIQVKSVKAWANLMVYTE